MRSDLRCTCAGGAVVLVLVGTCVYTKCIVYNGCNVVTQLVGEHG